MIIQWPKWIRPSQLLVATLITFSLSTALAQDKNDPRSGFFDGDVSSNGFFDKPRDTVDTNPSVDAGTTTLTTPAPTTTQPIMTTTTQPLQPGEVPNVNKLMNADSVRKYTDDVMKKVTQQLQQQQQPQQGVSPGSDSFKMPTNGPNAVRPNTSSNAPTITPGTKPLGAIPIPTVTTTLPKPSTTLPRTSQQLNPPPSAAPNSAPAASLRGKQYEKGILSLIVSAESQEHLDSALQKLEDLQRRQHVQVGQVLIVGEIRIYEKYLDKIMPTGVKRSKEEAKRSAFEVPAAYLHLQQMNLMGNGATQVGDVLQRLGIENSPTWVVRFGGQDHVFEGFDQPSRLFSPTGEFTATDENMSM